MVHSSSGDFWALLGTVLYPFLAIWRLISNFLFSNPPAQTSVRAAASETSNLASSSNSEKRYLFSPFAKYVSNAQCLRQNEKICYGYIVFFYKGNNPNVLKSYYIVSHVHLMGCSRTWVFSAIFLKLNLCKATSPLLVLLFHLLNSLHPIIIKVDFFFPGPNSNIFLVSHVLSVNFW